MIKEDDNDMMMTTAMTIKKKEEEGREREENEEGKLKGELESLRTSNYCPGVTWIVLEHPQYSFFCCFFFIWLLELRSGIYEFRILTFYPRPVLSHIELLVV